MVLCHDQCRNPFNINCDTECSQTAKFQILADIVSQHTLAVAVSQSISNECRQPLLSLSLCICLFRTFFSFLILRSFFFFFFFVVCVCECARELCYDSNRHSVMCVHHVHCTPFVPSHDVLYASIYRICLDMHTYGTSMYVTETRANVLAELHYSNISVFRNTHAHTLTAGVTACSLPLGTFLSSAFGRSVFFLFLSLLFAVLFFLLTQRIIHSIDQSTMFTCYSHALKQQCCIEE